MARLKLTFDIAAIVNSMEGVNAATKRAFLGITSNSDVKREIGKRLIDKILERTNRGIDKEDVRFTKYSLGYVNSHAFKVYNKSKTVNLKLTGDMQAAIDVIGMTSTSVTIGFVDKHEEEKARGHIEGTGANESLPIRDFWGLPLISDDFPKLDVQTVILDTIRDFNKNRSDFVDIIEEIPDVTGNVSISTSNLSEDQ